MLKFALRFVPRVTYNTTISYSFINSLAFFHIITYDNLQLSLACSYCLSEFSYLSMCENKVNTYVTAK